MHIEKLEQKCRRHSERVRLGLRLDSHSGWSMRGGCVPGNDGAVQFLVTRTGRGSEEIGWKVLSDWCI